MIIAPLCCFIAGYLICGWLIPGFESVYVVWWLALNPLRMFIQAAFKQRHRFQFLRQWPDNKIVGWGFVGNRSDNEGYFSIEWSRPAMRWRKPRTYWTRAMWGGITFDEWPRISFAIESDRSAHVPCFAIMIFLPQRHFPFGRFEIEYRPQHNEPEAAPC